MKQLAAALAVLLLAIPAGAAELDLSVPLDRFCYQTAPEVLRDGEGNRNYSPVSLYYALAMLTEGAAGATRDELSHLLLDGDDVSILPEACKAFYEELTQEQEGTATKIANALWANQRYSIRPEYRLRLRESFFAEARNVDFSKPQAAQEMKRWVIDQTNGTIVPDITTDPEQLISLMNTIYFMDGWGEKVGQGEARMFYPAKEEPFLCETLETAGGPGAVSRGEGFSRADIGLANGHRMVLVLPDEGIAPAELLADEAAIREAFTGGEWESGKIILRFPKFRFDNTIKLIVPLRTLGVEKAFGSEADLSGISRVPSWVSEVSQQTHIGVDEKGVEASAFTEIKPCPGAGPAQEDYRPPIVVNFDRPFLFGITGPGQVMLFIGVCENPAVL